MKNFNLIDKEKLSKISIPDQYKSIVDAIGIEKFIKLAEKIGGVTVYLPKASNLLKELRDQEIMDDRKRGLSLNELSKKYDLSITWVRTICNK